MEILDANRDVLTTYKFYRCNPNRRGAICIGKTDFSVTRLPETTSGTSLPNRHRLTAHPISKQAKPMWQSL